MRNAIAIAALAAMSLAACTSTKPAQSARIPGGGIGVARAPDAPLARQTGRPSTARATALKIGAPYQVRGVWYVPAHQPGYVEEGLASWYGEELAGRRTANGEAFDANLFTGAHTTLPMPSRVEVTNLDNGRSLEVRLNDRGPFRPGRLIDVSRAAAEELGFKREGQARVRVRYLGPADGLSVPVRPERPFTVAAAPAVSAPTTSAPDPAPVRVIAPRPGGSGWAVQAGSFSVVENADRAARTLAPAGRTEVRTIESGGRTLYRVLVGPWGDASRADSARREVAALGFADAKVIAGF